MILALYEPDIPQNTGSLIRLAACMDVPLHIIEPCGFPFDDKKLRRVAMDYYDHAAIVRHISWQAFLGFAHGGNPKRVVLLTTQTPTPYTQFTYQPEDILLLGRESSGVPEAVKNSADARVTIPMNKTVRSLNVALAASMVLGEALRQTRA